MSDKKLTYDPNWEGKYKSQITTADRAISEIQPGQRIFIGTGAAEPLELVEALARHGSNLPDCEIVHLLTFGEAPYAHKKLTPFFRINSFFIADNVRDIIQEGLGDYTPVFLSDIPSLFSSGQIPLDIALIQVTPPDERGMCSLGVSVDIVKSAVENAALVIAQVNPNMPRTMGNSQIHVLDLDSLIPHAARIPEVQYEEVTEETKQIAEYVAALIDDGSTLELGIGQIPQALLKFLNKKKNLGIHTEMFTDGIIDLIESGVINGTRKTLDREKVVASFCLGSQRLYDYIDGNPTFSFQSSDYVNDPFIISQQERMVAVNMALQVDLTGQVCADSLGTKFFSGVGGQVDFNRGAARSNKGKAIIALPSTAQNGEVSRIVSHLSQGAGVVTTRADVHYVITEYGVAYLHGKSIQERTLALISIAHPDFRPQLIRDAIKDHYLSADMASIEGKIVIGPKELRSTFTLDDGTQINFRPIHPTDAPKMRHLFYALSEQTIYYRFMSRIKRIPNKQIQDFVYIDHRNDIAIVGTILEAHGDEFVAIGRYYLDPRTNRAEVAFIVHDNWQNRGIGSFLFHALVRIARRNGIRGFSAEVLRENRAMQRVFNNAPFKVQSRMNGDVYSYEIDFD